MTATLVRAGFGAFAEGRMTDAVRALSRALDTLDPGVARLDVAIALASALARTGELERADALLVRTLADAGRDGDRVRALRAEVELRTQRLQTGRTSDDEVRRFAESAAVELQALGDEAGLAKALHLLGDVAATWAESEELFEQALTHSRRAADRRETADIVWWLGVIFHHAHTPVTKAIGRCEELLDTVAGDRTVEAGMLGMLAGLYAMQGSFDHARTLFTRGLRILEELGIALRLATRRTISGEIELLADDPVAAERELRWGYERLNEMGERGDLPAIAAQLAEALYRQGRLDEAEGIALAAEEAYGGSGTGLARARAVRAKIVAARGEYEAAVALAEEAVSLVDPERLNALGDSLLDLAQTLRLAGRDDEAAAEAERALAVYEQKENTVSAAGARTVLEQLQRCRAPAARADSSRAGAADVSEERPTSAEPTKPVK
jgi:tetratricopeptide (TPR) repeat protein